MRSVARLWPGADSSEGGVGRDWKLRRSGLQKKRL